jgi:hypothetical protein
VTLGSGPPAEVVLREPSVSRLHARITRRKDAFVVEDLGSENGLFLGPHRHVVCEVGFRQLFRIGRVALELLPDVATQVSQAKPSEPPAVALESFAVPAAERFPSSKRMAWILGSTAAAFTAVLFGTLQLTLVSRVAGHEAAFQGTTRLVMLTPAEVSRRVHLEGPWDLRVPSAAVTAPLGISVAPVANPRGPRSRLLAPAGPGILVDSVDLPLPGVGLQVTYSGNAEGAAPLLGRYRLHPTQFDLFGRDAPMPLVGPREYLVPLRLSETTAMRRVDEWSFVYDEGAFSDAESELRALAAELAGLRTTYRKLGYALFTPEPVVLLEADRFDDEPWCATAVHLPDRRDGWTRTRLERAYFATLLGRRVDCSPLAGAGSRLLEPILRRLSSAVPHEPSGEPASVAPASVAPASAPTASVVGLFVRDTATEDHTSKFFAYLTNTDDARRGWFTAMAAALVQRASPRRLRSSEQLAVLDVAARGAGHGSLALAWSDYVVHLDLPPHAVPGSGGYCDAARLLWQPDSVALRARLGCAARPMTVSESAPRRQRR